MPPFASPVSQVPFPALYLYPLNDSFVPKHISLLNNQRVKIGRQTNAKTVPAERNGYFDSKVLSRQHAEVWEDGGKILIKDVKSSNGTFINGERLSAEGLESEPFELKTDDIVEFGIDIVAEDNKTIIHHKVAARVVCVFSEQDAQAAARAEAQQNPANYTTLVNQGGLNMGNGPPAFSLAGANQAGVNANGVPGPQRRSTMQPQGLVGMGGMGGSTRPSGKSGLTFDHILSRLQGELQKSRETGAELHSVTGAMNDIHDTLGGNLPPNLPPLPQNLPPVVPPQAPQPAEANPPPAPAASSAPAAQDSASALHDLQAQLHETQLSLASHVDKIRALEGMLAEHEAIKREVSAMRDMMEDRKREMELLRIQAQSPTHMRRQHPHGEDDHQGEYMHDDDDARSVSTVVPHELERVEEEDEEQMAAEEEEEERRRRRDELRPRTPEPTGLGMAEDDEEHDSQLAHELEEPRPNTHLRPESPQPIPPASAPPQPAAPVSIPDDLTRRITDLADQLETALELSRSLEAQHTSAQSTISVLESKVSNLESLVQATQTDVHAQAESQQQLARTMEAVRSAISEAPASALALAAAAEEERARERESLTEMLNEWKKTVEGQWGDVREEWTEERERLKRAKEEWESRLSTVEDGFRNTTGKVEIGLASLASFQLQHQRPHANGNAKMNGGGGLVTPPSPRSLSAESTRPRQRKRRASSTRGRTRSRSESPAPSLNEHDGPSTLASHVRDEDSPSSSSRMRRRSPWATDDSSASDSEGLSASATVKPLSAVMQASTSSMQYPITPEPSLINQPLSTSTSGATEALTEEPRKNMQHNINNVSTMLGVLVLSAAAAAVIWRIKPEGGI